MVQVTRVPVGTLPPSAERRRDGRPTCLQCGNAGRLSRDCRLRPGKEVTDNRDWRKNCATGGRASAKRGTAASIQSSLLPDEKRRLEARIATLEKQNKKLKAKMAELETAQKTKNKASSSAAS
jgi:hypothetical protein